MATIPSLADIRPAGPFDGNSENAFRKETPGVSDSWARSPYPTAQNKYFMISADNHLAPPPNLFHQRLDKKFHPRLARVETDPDGSKWIIGLDSTRRERVHEVPMTGEDGYRQKAGGSRISKVPESASEAMSLRIADQLADGIDGEVVFPNGAGMYVFGTTDADLCALLCSAYNDWIWEICGPHKSFSNPVAAIATGSVENAVAEVYRVAKLGFRVLTLPAKPIYGPPDPAQINYNLPVFDPLWAAIEETDMTMTFHVSTARDPRAARGNGGAVINYLMHSVLPTLEPMTNLCASGVFDRFPKLRFCLIETGVGWAPWAMQVMDEAYLKHHFWVRPQLKHGLPSDYFRAHGATTFAEDVAGLQMVEAFNLQDNIVFANDYPHHEGTWPYSAQAIERQLACVSEETRAKALGLNAARLFKFDVPEKFKQ